MGRNSGLMLGSLGRLFSRGTVTGLDEDELLDRFVVDRDEAAFAALVTRHGPTVLGVCRRILRDDRDIEDAFQATFLILVRRAGSIRDGRLIGRWLHGVAHRVAVRTRAQSARRYVRERPAAGDVESAERSPSGTAVEREWMSALDEELTRLPGTLRSPMVLCYLEGLTHDEAAHRLGWPVGTVRSRMARARDLLRRRLSRRGILANGAVLPASMARPTVPVALIDSTVRISCAFMTKSSLATAAASLAAAGLANEVLHAMMLTRLTVLGATGLSCVLALGGPTLARQFGGGGHAATGIVREAEPIRIVQADPPSPPPVEIGRRSEGSARQKPAHVEPQHKDKRESGQEKVRIEGQKKISSKLAGSSNSEVSKQEKLAELESLKKKRDDLKRWRTALEQLLAQAKLEVGEDQMEFGLSEPVYINLKNEFVTTSINLDSTHALIDRLSREMSGIRAEPPRIVRAEPPPPPAEAKSPSSGKRPVDPAAAWIKKEIENLPRRKAELHEQSERALGNLKEAEIKSERFREEYKAAQKQMSELTAEIEAKNKELSRVAAVSRLAMPDQGAESKPEQVTPTTFKMGDIVFIVSPRGDKVSAASLDGSKLKSVKLSDPGDPPKKIDLAFKEFSKSGDEDGSSASAYVTFHQDGGAVHRLAVFVVKDWSWHVFTLPESVTRAGVAVWRDHAFFQLDGGAVAAYSLLADTWDLLKFDTTDSDGIEPTTEGTVTIIKKPGHYYRYDAKTGKWSDLDTRALLDQPDRDAPRP